MIDSGERGIAIIGLACRFPDAANTDQFWRNLQVGKSSIRQVPSDRWLIGQHYDPASGTAGKSISKWGGFLEDVRAFDARFFEIPDEEARVMDPQHRILLELAHETLEGAGYTNEKRDGLRIGVFLGISHNGYEEYTKPILLSSEPTPQNMVANNLRNLAAGRVAHYFDLTGPNLAIDAACASSLVAVHYACLSLQAGECDLALAGGINLNLTATPFLAFSSAGALSPSPFTYLFDERADGFVLGEGGGLVLLTPLQRAQVVGDPVQAVILGSAVNNDGRSLGLMAPNPAGQKAVLAAAYLSAAIDPGTVSYVEAHGTGTRIGDAVEARSLTRFFPPPEDGCSRYVGSVKTNIGHLLSGAGIAGLIKAVLAMRNQEIPPSLNHEHPRANLKLQRAGFVVNTSPVTWDGMLPRRAGVSSFGFGGTNAHVVLQEAQTPAEPIPALSHTFERVEYWAPLPPEQPGTSFMRQENEAHRRWLHVVDWEPVDFAGGQKQSESRDQRVLIVSEDAVPAVKLLDHLTSQGWSVGSATLSTLEGTLDGEQWLVYLDRFEEDRLGHYRVVTPGLERLLAAAQIIINTTEQRRPRRMIIVTSWSQHTGHFEEMVRPHRAAIAGLGLSLSDELGIPVQVLDLDRKERGSDWLSFVGEVLIWRPETAVIARRNGRSFRRTVSSMATDQISRRRNQNAIRKDGVYLITGGAGGVGSAIARGLTLDCTPTMILVGRRPLAESPDIVDLLEKLCWAGAKADYIPCDVSQADQVDDLLQIIGERHGILTGIIHVAGLIRPGKLSNKTLDHFEAVFAPKALGAANLIEAVERHDLAPTFFVAFSSITSILAGFSGGLADYAAANAYIDAVVLSRARGRSAKTTINWTIWSETGRGANAMLLRHLAGLGLEGIGTDDAYAVFREAVTNGLTQLVAVNTGATLQGGFAAASGLPQQDISNARSDVSIAESPATIDVKVEQDVRTGSPGIEKIRQILIDLLADEMETTADEVSLDQSFTAMDLDSMTAIDLVLTLEQKGFGSLPPTLFFEYNTINKLARYLAKQDLAIGEHRTDGVRDDNGDVSWKQNRVVVPHGFSLSPVQLAFYTNHHLRPEEVAYAFLRQTVRGPLDARCLQRAINQLTANHGALRTTFTFDPEERRPKQIVHPATNPAFLTRLELAKSLSDLARLEDEIVNQPLNIAAGELLRVIALETEEPDLWHLLLHVHHIAADGWSLSLLAQELWRQYFSILNEGRSLEGEVITNFQDYVALVEEESNGPVHEETLAWWVDRLQRYHHYRPVLPYDNLRKVAGPEQRAFAFAIDATHSKRLKDMASENGLSLFHLLMAVFYRCLHKWSGEHDLIIGVAEARRDYALAGIRSLVGCMADVFPLHLTVAGDESLLALAKRVRDRWLQVHAHTHLSSIDLQRLLPDHQHDEEAPALSQANFSFARFPLSFPDEANVRIVGIFGRTATAVTRLSLVCWEFNDQLQFSWNYPGYLFQEGTVAGFTSDYVDEVKSAVDMEDFQGPALNPIRQVSSFLNQIEFSWQTQPQHAAVAIADRQLPYKDLARQVGQLSASLSEAGVERGDVVAFLGGPGMEAIVAILAIMRSGATWLPLDPTNPSQRLRMQINITEARHLVYDPQETGPARKLQRVVDSLIPVEQGGPGVDAPAAVAVYADDIAYIIFTSGSTGQPKGVPITFQALDDYLNWAIRTFDYGPEDVAVLASSLAFDASLRPCLAPLMRGGTVRPVSLWELRGDPRHLLAMLEQEGITIWSSVPSLWRRLLRVVENEAQNDSLPDLSCLRLVQLGGEILDAEAIRRWQNYYGVRTRFANLYGPTETTISATCYHVHAELDPEDSIVPIGRPLPGLRLKVVDENWEPCEPGVKGELMIGGSAVTPGYCGDVGPDSGKFWIADDGQRYFRTGDLVVERRDGNLVFLGRNDNQVKLRGYRIELEEIAHALEKNPAIEHAVVVLSRQNGIQRLIAFLVTAERTPTAGELRAFLEQDLPHYMVPHDFQVLKALPLLANGKVDRIRLVKMANDESQNRLSRSLVEGRKPETEVEKALAAVWRQVLGVNVVTCEDDFFALGGDSLHMLEVLVLLEDLGFTVDSAAELYRHRTLADQAQSLAPLALPLPKPLADCRPESNLLSPAQTGFLMTRSMNPPKPTTWSAYFWLEGELDLDIFNRALAIMVARHPMLRTVCLPDERPPLQKEIDPKWPLEVRFEELDPQLSKDPWRLSNEIRRRLNEEGSHLFDLSTWPLIKMRLCRLAVDCHIWFVAADHFIGDALSGWIFGSELLEVVDSLIAGQEVSLPPLRTTFQDYVPLALERESRIDDETAAYWRNVYTDPYEQPVLGRLNAGSVVDGEEWLHEVWELDPEEFAELKRQAAGRGQTAHDTLLTLYYRRLSSLTDRTDLIIGTAVSGRDYPLPGLMKIFGSFATMLPIRINQTQADTLESQIMFVGEQFAQARVFKRSPKQIARIAGSNVPLTALTGLQFIFSFMDFENMDQPYSDNISVRWDRSQTELQPPRLSTDIVLSARALDGHLRLTFSAAAQVMGPSQLSAFVRSFQVELKSLLTAQRPLKKMDWATEHRRLEAALVGYLPQKTLIRDVSQELGLDFDEERIRALLFPEGRPSLLEIATTPLGRSGTICIPLFADELDVASPAELGQLIIEADEIARTAGAQCVSMAGLLPAKTRYGHAALELAKNDSSLSLTTGHSLTAVAVVKNIYQALIEVDYDPQAIDMVFLGLGSIGSSVLILYLTQCPHPRSILLCDVAASQSRLEQLRDQLINDHAFKGKIRLLRSSKKAPTGVYEADVIVGATSSPNILDVERVRPGTLVIDDSSPYCFDRNNAVSRMNSTRDVLFVGAGLLNCGPIQRYLCLPAGAPISARRILEHLPSEGIPGCQLEALLHAQQPHLPLTQGLVTKDSALAYWEASEAFNLHASRLHLDSFLPDRNLINRVGRLWRRSRLVKQA